MSAAWDGIPQNPEVSGPHWLRTSSGEEFITHWNADLASWIAADGDDEYIGPVLFPADHTRLTARVAKLEAALRDPRFLFKQPGENSTDAFERIALRFYEECHVLAPGKSQPLAFNGTPTDEEWREAYDARIAAFHNRAAAALTPEVE